MSEIKNFYKEYKDMFEEYLEDIIGNLKIKMKNINNYKNNIMSY